MQYELELFLEILGHEVDQDDAYQLFLAAKQSYAAEKLERERWGKWGKAPADPDETTLAAYIAKRDMDQEYQLEMLSYCRHILVPYTRYREASGSAAASVYECWLDFCTRQLKNPLHREQDPSDEWLTQKYSTAKSWYRWLDEPLSLYPKTEISPISAETISKADAKQKVFEEYGFDLSVIRIFGRPQFDVWDYHSILFECRSYVYLMYNGTLYNVLQ